jgi:cyclopropane fatty-acyl-phospholipid synthase-like methyltransferase
MDEHTKSVREFYDILRWSGIDVGSALGEKLNQRIAFLLEKTQPDKELPILDMGCGNGRYSVALAKLGYRVVGVDFDETSIEEARKLALEQNVDVSFICSDINEAELKPDFGLVFSVQFFQHLRDNQRDVCLQRVRELLVSNGKLFVEMPYHKCFCDGDSGQDEWNDYVQLYKGCYNPETKENVSEMVFIRKSDRVERNVTTRSRVYSSLEIDELLKRENFENVVIYGDWDGRDIDNDCCRIIFVAQKGQD